MKVIAALASPLQDEVIRSVLEARGEWDPPWLRARAPPAIAARVGQAGEHPKWAVTVRVDTIHSES